MSNEKKSTYVRNQHGTVAHLRGCRALSGANKVAFAWDWAEQYADHPDVLAALLNQRKLGVKLCGLCLPE